MCTYTNNKTFRGVSCLNDNWIWTCGHADSNMRLYHLQGVLMESIRTTQGTNHEQPVTTDENLVYTDLIDRSINEVINARVEALIR